MKGGNATKLSGKEEAPFSRCTPRPLNYMSITGYGARQREPNVLHFVGKNTNNWPIGHTSHDSPVSLGGGKSGSDRRKPGQAISAVTQGVGLSYSLTFQQLRYGSLNQA